MEISDRDIPPQEQKPLIPMPTNITIGEKYGYAMTITDQAEADAYFEACVEHSVSKWAKSRAEAETIERSNLGYFAGYYSFEVRQRVEKLFGGIHPIFGSTDNGPVSDRQAFEAGKALGEVARKKKGGYPMQPGDTVVVLDEGLYRGTVCRVIRIYPNGNVAVAPLSDTDPEPETRPFEPECLTTDLVEAVRALDRDTDDLSDALIEIRGEQQPGQPFRGARTLEEARAIADRTLRADRPVGK